MVEEGVGLVKGKRTGINVQPSSTKAPSVNVNLNMNVNVTVNNNGGNTQNKGQIEADG